MAKLDFSDSLYAFQPFFEPPVMTIGLKVSTIDSQCESTITSPPDSARDDAISDLMTSVKLFALLRRGNQKPTQAQEKRSILSAGFRGGFC